MFRKEVSLLMVTFLLCGVIFNAFTAPADVETLSKVGSKGEEVTQIQIKLRDLGLYTGKIDGIFGEGTRKAVVAFQKQKGLTQDGIAGPQTLKALGVVDTGQGTHGVGNISYNQSDRNLLAHVISAEARGEPFDGQVAVGAVVLNRVKHPSFPNTIAGVIYQKGAFTAVVDGQFNEAIDSRAYVAADSALSGVDPSGGAIYYYNPAKTTNKWIYSRPVIKVIGSHVFAGE